MKVAKGEIVTVGGQDATVTKVSALPRGIIDGKSKPGSIRVTPMYRIYWKIGSKQGHADAVIGDGVEVVCG